MHECDNKNRTVSRHVFIVGHSHPVALFFSQKFTLNSRCRTLPDFFFLAGVARDKKCAESTLTYHYCNWYYIPSGLLNSIFISRQTSLGLRSRSPFGLCLTSDEFNPPGFPVHYSMGKRGKNYNTLVQTSGTSLLFHPSCRHHTFFSS